jgi:hypothetical protein
MIPQRHLRRNRTSFCTVEPDTTNHREDFMNKLAIAMLLAASPAFAQTTAAIDCPPIGQSAKGELIYAMNCSAIKAENRNASYQPPMMPATNLSATVIPRSGATESPEKTPTDGSPK